jgi:hypothetical protein
MAITGYRCITCGEYTERPKQIEAHPTRADEVGRVERTYGPYCEFCARRKSEQLSADYERMNRDRDIDRREAKEAADRREDEYYRKWGKHSWE